MGDAWRSSQIHMPFIVKLFIVPSVALRFMGGLLKLLDQASNFGIYKPFLADLIQPILFDEGE
jgi:hypothetical protein